MPRGGARNRSGPQADEGSLTSARKGLVLTALPSEGYRGEAPEFPLSLAVVYYEYVDADGVRHRRVDEDATEIRRDREASLWAWAWSTPQACAWEVQPWRWHAVAMWVRTAALCESPDATAADKNSLHRFADQIGLTPAGLKENGWKIAADEVDEKRTEKAPAKRSSSRSRLTVVQRDGGN